MANFPTLATNPIIDGWEEGLSIDPTIRSQSEGGYIQTRARFTRLTEKWNVKYMALSTADKDTLRDFEKTVFAGSDAFNWTNPANSTSYSVRFLGLMKCIPHSNSLYWDVSFVLEEV